MWPWGTSCTIGYLAGCGRKGLSEKALAPRKISELPDNFLSFCQDTYLAMAVVMVPMYLIPAIAAGPQYIAQFSGGINYLMYAFMQSIQLAAGGFVPYGGVRLLLNELVPTFRGIAMRIVRMQSPLSIAGAISYAPNAVIVDFW